VTPQLGSGSGVGGVETGTVVSVPAGTDVSEVVVVVSGIVPVTGGVAVTPVPEPDEVPVAGTEDDEVPVAAPEDEVPVAAPEDEPDPIEPDPAEADPDAIGPSSIGATAQDALKARTVTPPLVRVKSGFRAVAPPSTLSGRYAGQPAVVHAAATAAEPLAVE
jgi:hypothetical protein